MPGGGWKYASLGAVATIAAVSSACLDVAPVTVALPATDAGLGDAVGAPDTVMCASCIASPDDAGCANEVVACNALPVCKATFACATANACFERGSLSGIEVCGLPCATEAGAAVGTSSYAASLQAFACVISRCGPSCGIPVADAGADH